MPGRDDIEQLTAGQRGDSPQFIPVLRKIRVARIDGGRPRTRPDLVLADRAYTSKANRAHLRARGIKSCIPSKAGQDAHRKAKGLRHLAFVVDNVTEAAAELRAKGVPTEEVRIDELTGKKFVFFNDPNGQPLELYEETTV